MVSQYYLQEQTFKLRKDHFTFESRVKFIFKRMQTNEDGTKSFNFGILLEDGHIEVIDSEDKSDHAQWSIQRKQKP